MQGLLEMTIRGEFQNTFHKIHVASVYACLWSLQDYSPFQIDLIVTKFKLRGQFPLIVAGLILLINVIAVVFDSAIDPTVLIWSFFMTMIFFSDQYCSFNLWLCSRIMDHDYDCDCAEQMKPSRYWFVYQYIITCIFLNVCKMGE